jgi:allantoinase
VKDISIKSKKIITPEGIVDGVIVIRRGIIKDILSHGNDVGLVMDAGDSVVMPGVIDPHVHINEPGRTEWEGFDTATRAAMAGGITTVVDMPLNSSPVTTSVDAFEKKLKATKGQLHINCGFWGGVVPGNEKEIEPLINKGVLGFKAFLTHSGIDEFPNVTEADLRKIMPVIAAAGLPLLVHCELTDDLNRAGGDPRSYQNYLKSRPRKWEDDAIALVIKLCEEYNCRVHIVHLSSSDSIAQIVKAKEKGLPLTVETAQHYLFFDDQVADGCTQYKCAPPIREKENNEKLWDALKKGIIDFVATDHSPATPGLKRLQTGNFMKAWGGIAGIQFALPVLWTAAQQRNCSIIDVSKWLSLNPAKFTGLIKKGRIQKGCDADLTIWDPENNFSVTEDIILHKHKITPYLDYKLSGVVEQTYLAGEKIYDHGEMVLNRGKILLSER